jgi:hypothetical protein
LSLLLFLVQLVCGAIMGLAVLAGLKTGKQPWGAGKFVAVRAETPIRFWSAQAVYLTIALVLLGGALWQLVDQNNSN